MQATQSEYLTVAEVAERFRCSPEHVRGLVNRGELRAVRLGDSQRAPIRVDAGALDRWLEASANRSAQP